MSRILLITSSHEEVLKGLLLLRLGSDVDIDTLRVTSPELIEPEYPGDSYDWIFISVHPGDLGMNPCHEFMEDLARLVHHAAKRAAGPVLVEGESFWTPFPWVLIGVDIAQIEILAEYNSNLLSEIEQIPGVQLVLPKIDHNKRYLESIWGRVQCAIPPQASVDSFVEHMKVLRTKQIKVLVCDFDGVLWGGVVGEGTQTISTEHPSNAYRLVQHFLLECRKRGYLLAGSTKNTLENVNKAFSHPDMVLRKDDFVHICSDWRPKSEHIKEIAETLNLKTNSFLFIDDNDSELIEVQSNIQDILVFDGFANRSLATTSALMKLSQMECLRRGAGNDRTQYYQTEMTRRADKLSMKDLQIKVKLHKNEYMRRVEELFSRTTQFNLSGWVPEVGDYLSGEYDFYCISAEDKYGSLGVVGAAAVQDDKVRNLVMSCRVLGRGIEEAFIHLLNQQDPYTALIYERQNTGRNKASIKFFEGEKWMELPEHIEVTE